jgi:hypothetical protein
MGPSLPSRLTSGGGWIRLRGRGEAGREHAVDLDGDQRQRRPHARLEGQAVGDPDVDGLGQGMRFGWSGEMGADGNRIWRCWCWFWSELVEPVLVYSGS